MVLINELTVEQINAALLHLQRSKDEVVGGNKGTTIQNISISNSGGGGNNVDYSGTIKNLATNIEKNKTAIEKNASDIAKLKSDMANIEKSVEDTLQGLVDNGISDLSFDPLTKQLTITTNDGDTFQTTITQDIGVLSYDSATNKLILTTGEQTQEITLPYIKAGEKGSANGVATLDENGRVPYSQLPESAMEFLGQWDASTNTPHLADGTGTNGDFYIVSVGGTVNFGTAQNPRNVTFSINDRAIYEGDIAQWVRLPAGQVSSVNGQSGEVTLTANDIEYSTGVSIKAKIDANAVQADWNVTDTTSLAYIKNKPTIPASPVQSDWNVTDTTSLAYIKNKPSVAVLGNTAGCALGTASAGSCTTAARSDHVHPMPAVLGGIALNAGNNSNYNEGLRINVANNGYSTLNIGAAAGTTSGAGGFWIGTNCTTAVGKLYINYGTSNKASYFCCCSDGTVFWCGNVCGTVSCATNADTIDGYHACDLAKGNLKVYSLTLTPRQLNTPATLSSIVSEYSVGSLINFTVTWDEYQSFSYAGAQGIILISGSSAKASGFFRRHIDCGYSKGFHWTDNITSNKFTGIYDLSIPKATCADHATSADNVGALSWTSCGCGVYVSGCFVRFLAYMDEECNLYKCLKCFAKVVSGNNYTFHCFSVIGSKCCTVDALLQPISCFRMDAGKIWIDGQSFCSSSTYISSFTNYKMLAIC